MMMALLESLCEYASVPFQHYLTRVAVFESVKSDITVKNAIFTAFYGTLRHKMIPFGDGFT